MMLKFLLLSLLLVSGCAQYTAFTAASRSHGAEIADGTLSAAQFTLCNVITVGAWAREYRRDKEKAEAWKTLCYESDKGQTPVETK